MLLCYFIYWESSSGSTRQRTYTSGFLLFRCPTPIYSLSRSPFFVVYHGRFYLVPSDTGPCSGAGFAIKDVQLVLRPMIKQLISCVGHLVQQSAMTINNNDMQLRSVPCPRSIQSWPHFVCILLDDCNMHKLAHPLASVYRSTSICNLSARSPLSKLSRQ